MASHNNYAGVRTGITLVYCGLLISLTTIVATISVPVFAKLYVEFTPGIPPQTVSENVLMSALKIGLIAGLIIGFAGKLKCLSVRSEVGTSAIYLAALFDAAALGIILVELACLIPGLAVIGASLSEWLRLATYVFVLLGIACFLFFLGILAEHIWSERLRRDLRNVFGAFAFLVATLVVLAIMLGMSSGLLGIQTGDERGSVAVWFAMPWVLLFGILVCIIVVVRYARLLSRFRSELADK